MPMRALVVVAVLAIAILGYVAWNQTSQRAQQGGEAAQQSMPPGDMSGGMPDGGQMTVSDQAQDPGMAWDLPAGWLAQTTGSSMRLASYTIPGKGQGKEAECAVYYFGAGKGGGVEPNLQRWVGEFSKLDKHDMRTRDVNGMKVSIVEVYGTYASHGMTPGEDAGPRDDWALLGAIAESPNGDIFFKLTGPKATVSSAVRDFEGMLGTIKKKA